MIQSDVDTISDWIKKKIFSALTSKKKKKKKKCKQLIITRQKHSVPFINMTLSGKALELVSAYKYLAVRITSDLSWTKQIEENYKKAIGMILLLFLSVLFY